MCLQTSVFPQQSELLQSRLPPLILANFRSSTTSAWWPDTLDDLIDPVLATAINTSGSAWSLHRLAFTTPLMDAINPSIFSGVLSPTSKRCK